MPARESLLDRFCRYVRVDTQSSATSTSYPSTEKQKDLLRILVDDLKAAGLADAEMDEHGYVMATLPSNIPPGHPSFGKVPVIGLLAHVDTYFEVSGTGVKPQVHRNYDGGDITLPGDPAVVIRAAEEPALAACKGMTIVTADGTTLLGADDKAGVAEILEALWRLHDDPARLHGPIRVAFTPDEEVGRGTEHFDVKKFGARLRLHRGRLGRRANSRPRRSAPTRATVTISGADVHPGYAKGKMVNAVRIAADIVMALPQHRTPETTEGREGYLHPTNVVRQRLGGEAELHRARLHRGGAARARGHAPRRGGLGRAEVPGLEGDGRGQGVVPQHEVRPRPAPARHRLRGGGDSPRRPRPRSGRRSAAAPTAPACRSWASRRRTCSTAA